MRLESDPGLDRQTQFVGSIIAAGFASLSVVVAVALTNEPAIAFAGGTVPAATALLATLHFTDHADQGSPDPNTGTDSDTTMPNTDDSDRLVTATDGGELK